MFGTNPVRKQTIEDGASLRVQEIFKTVQGEGPHAGRPAIFIRLAGCNLRCTFCDTDFESGYENKLTIVQIMERIAAAKQDANVSLVVITGGEPLLQNIVPLIRLLRRSTYDVQIETAGTVWLPDLDQLLFFLGADSLVCSPKTAKIHPSVARMCSHWKYIVSETNISDEDGLPNMSTQPGTAKEAPLFRPEHDFHGVIWVQPLDSGDATQNIKNLYAAIESSMKFGYRLSVQIHKVIGLP